MTLTPEDIARLKSLMLRYEDIKRPPGVATELLSLAIEMLPSLLAAAERCGELEKENGLWKDTITDELEQTGILIDALGVRVDVENGKGCMDAMIDRIASLTAAESRATQAEARVRELEGKAAEQRALLDRWNAVSEKGDDELSKAAGLMKEMRKRYTQLETQLAAARDGLEKILSGIEPYPGDIARDTLARIGGEA